VKRVRRLMLLWASALFVASSVLSMTAREAKKKAFDSLNEGTLAYEQGDYRRAVDLLREAAAISLNSFQAHYELGLALRDSRLYSDALEPLGIALELNPKHLQAHVAKGDCYLKLGDAAEAEAEYQRALDLQPDYAAAFDGLGRLMEARGRPEEAVTRYRRAIEVNAGYPNAYLDLGDLYQRQGKLQEATTLLLKAIQIRPDFAGAFNRLGVVYARQRLWQEAIAALREAERLEPRNPYHPYTLGRTYRDLGSLRWARESLERALKLDPAFPEVYVDLSSLERRERNYDAALAILDRGLTLVSDGEELEQLREERARVEEERERLARLEERVAHDGGPVEALALARIYEEGGDYERASRVLDSKVDAGKTDPTLVAEMGYYQIKAHRFAEAERTFAALVLRQADDYSTQVNLGIALAGVGRYEQALDAYRAALRLKPQAPEAPLYLGNLFLRLGEYARAAESYEAYLKVASDEEGVGRVRKILALVGRLRNGESSPEAAAAAPEKGKP